MSHVEITSFLDFTIDFTNQQLRILQLYGHQIWRLIPDIYNRNPAHHLRYTEEYGVIQTLLVCKWRLIEALT